MVGASFTGVIVIVLETLFPSPVPSFACHVTVLVGEFSVGCSLVVVKVTALSALCHSVTVAVEPDDVKVSVPVLLL